MSTNNKTCNKCKKLFSSEYLLNKHLNRVVPCGTVLNCTICKKIFYNTTLLVSHENRKIPCKIATVKLADKIVLINAKEQSEINILNAKLIIKQQITRDVEEAKQKIQDSKIAAALKIQEMKDASKYNTAKIINDRAELEKQRVALNKKAEDEMEYEIMYKIAYKASKFTKNFFDDNGLDEIVYNLSRGLNEERCIEIFKKAETCNEIVYKLLKDILCGDDPKNKNLFYNSRIAMFSAITVETTNDTRRIIISPKSYEQVFNMLMPLLAYCYKKFNGCEAILYEYKCDNIRAKNDIAQKFQRFDMEQQIFTDLIEYNSKFLDTKPQQLQIQALNTQIIALQKSQNKVVKVELPKPLVHVKTLLNNLQNIITTNTNIYT